MKRIIDKQTKIFLRDDFTFDEETEIGLDVQPSQGLYQPQWNFETLTWCESATQEYIDSLKQPVVEEVPLGVRVTNIEQEQIIDVLAEMLGV